MARTLSRREFKRTIAEHIPCRLRIADLTLREECSSISPGGRKTATFSAREGLLQRKIRIVIDFKNLKEISNGEFGLADENGQLRSAEFQKQYAELLRST